MSPSGGSSLPISGATVNTGAIVFTDMVDSTALRSRLGDDRADLLRIHHDQLLRTTVEAHRGSVLRWTGDGAKAGFPTSSDAVEAAVAIQRAIAAYSVSPAAVAAFQIRIGVAAGELAVDEGGDHRGVAVIEAARLEALARPGEILATDVVRVLGQRRSRVVFEEVGERTLKGLDLPVLVYRVVDIGAGTTPPIPRLLTADHRSPLVGRHHAVERFRAHWAEARSGAAQLIVVRGQAGIGKSRLVSYCAGLAHEEGAIVLAGSCGSDVEVPYEPIAMALRAVSTLDESLKQAITAHHGPLARLFPISRAEPTSTASISGAATTTLDSAETASSVSTSISGPMWAGDGSAVISTRAREELFEAVTDLIRRLSRTHPLVVVIEDLHWATASTAQLLKHLIDDRDDRRLLIVATCRAEDLGGAHPAGELIAAAASSPRSSVVDLAPLGETDVARLVSAIAPDAPLTRVAQLSEFVHRESAGNPFFASELLHHLAATGQLERALDGSTGDRLPVPDSVHNVVAQRLARLTPGTDRVLQYAAVIGPSFDLDLLADVVGRPADDLLDLLEDVARAGIIREIGVDRFAFVHTIVRSTLIDELSASRQARAHRRVAEALETRGGEQFDELARHWQLAGEAARSTSHLARAARRDMSALAFESARTRYQQVVDLLTHDPRADLLDRARAWLGLGAATRELSDPGFIQMITRAARLARTARNGEVMAEAAALSTWLGSAFFTAEAPDDELIELCEDALELIDEADPMRVRVLATLASHLTFAPQREPRMKLIAEATELAARHRDPILTAAVLNAEFACLWDPTTLDRREQIAGHLTRLARATGDPQIEFLSGFYGAYCLVERAELVEARARLVELALVAEATRFPYHTFLVERLALTIDLTGCPPDAQQRVDAFLAKFGPTQPDAEGTWVVQTGTVAYSRGTFGELVHALSAMTTGPQARVWVGGHALALLWSGDPAAATEVLERPNDLPMNYFWTVSRQVRADAVAGLGRTDECRRLFDDLLPFRGRAGVSGAGSVCCALVSRTLGMLALALDEFDSAIDLLTEANAQADRVGFVFEQAVGRRLLAEAYLATGRPRQADVLIAEATILAERHRFTRERELLGALQARVGERTAS